MTADEIAKLIPDDVVEAAAADAYEAYIAMRRGGNKSKEAWALWLAAPESIKPRWRVRARATLAVGLAAWPGASVSPGVQNGLGETPSSLIMPLKREPRT
jgi:hypothetical protein